MWLLASSLGAGFAESCEKRHRSAGRSRADECAWRGGESSEPWALRARLLLPARALAMLQGPPAAFCVAITLTAHRGILGASLFLLTEGPRQWPWYFPGKYSRLTMPYLQFRKSSENGNVFRNLISNKTWPDLKSSDCKNVTLSDGRLSVWCEYSYIAPQGYLCVWLQVRPWALLRLWGTHGICVDFFPQIGELLNPEMEASLRIPEEALLIHSVLFHLHHLILSVPFPCIDFPASLPTKPSYFSRLNLKASS